jgi:hypothetical protein
MMVYRGFLEGGKLSGESLFYKFIENFLNTLTVIYRDTIE